MSDPMNLPRKQRGIALITSMLLLMIITILAVSMFRSYGTQERIAGNLREKERALHAANSAQEYAEWWLLIGNNTANGSVACTASLVASATEGQICNTTIVNTAGMGYQTLLNPDPVNGWTGQVTVQPLYMVVGNTATSGNTNPPYFAYPAFWITDLGEAADASGEAYQIDAYGYGGSQGALAVVESTYEVQQGVVNRGSL